MTLNTLNTIDTIGIIMFYTCVYSIIFTVILTILTVHSNLLKFVKNNLCHNYDKDIYDFIALICFTISIHYFFEILVSNSHDLVKMLHRLVTLYTIPNLFKAYYNIQKLKLKQNNNNNTMYQFVPVNYHKSPDTNIRVPYKRVRIPSHMRYMWEQNF